MAKFYSLLSEAEMARDIAGLINAYNKLTIEHNAESILNSNITYFTEVCLKYVVGCVGIVREEDISRIKHLSVHPSFRRFGVARRLLQKAIENSETSIVFMTIRDDNVACLRLAESMGFKIWKKTWYIDHFVYMVGRGINNVEVCFDGAC